MENVEFKCGNLCYSEGVSEILKHPSAIGWFIADSLTSYLKGNWGDISPEDAAINEAALKNGNRLYGMYRYDKDLAVCFVTEPDRSKTTILLDNEYILY